MDDKVHLVPPDGSIHQAVEDPPPEYTIPADQYPPPEYSESVGYWSPGGQQNEQPAVMYNQLALEFSQPATKPVVQQPASQTTVAMLPTSKVIVQEAAVKPPDYLWLACLVYWLCTFLVGTVAIALSMASSDAAEAKRIQEARNYGRAALGTSVFGIVLGLTMMIAIAVISLHRMSDDTQ